MENSVTTDYAGTVKQVLVQPGENVATDAVLVDQVTRPAHSSGQGQQPVYGRLPFRAISSRKNSIFAPSNTKPQT